MGWLELHMWQDAVAVPQVARAMSLASTRLRRPTEASLFSSPLCGTFRS
jgi:hypothetical protein